jgi:hypothetical protein
MTTLPNKICKVCFKEINEAEEMWTFFWKQPEGTMEPAHQRCHVTRLANEKNLMRYLK